MPRLIKFSRTGDPDVLQFVDVPVPVPAEDQVLIRTRAIGLNRAESMYRRGQYIFETMLPAQLGTEAAGIVEAVGHGVEHLKPGDAVNLLPQFAMGDYGIYGEQVIAPAHAVIAQPPGIDFAQGAAAWVMFLTAYGPLIHEAGLQRGEHVLITAASSSVGLAAIQLANLIGAIPIAVTRTGAKRELLLDAGAKHVIAYQEDKLDDEVLRITSGKGVRVAFDPIGGDLLADIVRAMSPRGTIYLYGALADEDVKFSALDALSRMVVIRGWVVADFLADQRRRSEAISFLSSALSKGELKPVIDRSFEFDHMVQAHRYLESSQQFGKIVVMVD